jgi:succinoglycan biosynthesis transport protein ExoP
VLSLFALAGVVLSFGAGLLREMLDHVYRTRLDVENGLKRDCLAMVPLIRSRQIKQQERFPVHLPVTNAEISRRVFSNHGIALTHIIREPFSEFSEATRALKLAVDSFLKGAASKVIGVTATLSGEGKSTIASALAGLSGLTGGKVILLDCDLCNPVLTLALTPQANDGLLEVLSGACTLSDAVWTDLVTEIDFLPAGNVSDVAHTTQIFTGDAMKALLNQLRAKYKYIIVDLSPLMPVVDVRATTDLVDGYLYVIEWGRTRIDHVNEALGGAPGVYENIIGFVLNKVDADTIGRYRPYQMGYNRHGYLTQPKRKAIKDFFRYRI